MHIFLQKSVPIQPKTNNILPKFCQPTLSWARGLEGVEHAARLPGGDLVAEGWRLVRGEAGRFSNSWSSLDFKRYGKVPQTQQGSYLRAERISKSSVALTSPTHLGRQKIRHHEPRLGIFSFPSQVRGHARCKFANPRSARSGHSWQSHWPPRQLAAANSRAGRAEWIILRSRGERVLIQRRMHLLLRQHFAST